MNKLAVVLMGFSVLAAVPAVAATVVPTGNRSVEQPQVPGGSASRTKALKTSYDAKYRKVISLLRNDKALRQKIVAVAHQFDISPLHIAGAIVGEHTYNVDAYDRLQTYYVKAVSYLSSSFSFSYEGEDIGTFIQRPQFARCESLPGSYAVWTCREDVWNASFKGKSVDGKQFPNNRFSAVFFQPFYAGQTFGIGQLNPLTALQMTDTVSKVTGAPTLDYRDPQAVYSTIMDPDQTLPYVAATLRKAIDAYRTIAGFDISQNPGLTATLYNVGGPEARAYALKAENQRRVAAGQELKLPEENYYGWLVNDRLADIEALF